MLQIGVENRSEILEMTMPKSNSALKDSNPLLQRNRWLAVSWPEVSHVRYVGEGSWEVEDDHFICPTLASFANEIAKLGNEFIRTCFSGKEISIKRMNYATESNPDSTSQFSIVYVYGAKIDDQILAILRQAVAYFLAHANKQHSLADPAPDITLLSIEQIAFIDKWLNEFYIKFAGKRIPRPFFTALGDRQDLAIAFQARFNEGDWKPKSVNEDITGIAQPKGFDLCDNKAFFVPVEGTFFRSDRKLTMFAKWPELLHAAGKAAVNEGLVEITGYASFVVGQESMAELYLTDVKVLPKNDYSLS